MKKEDFDIHDVEKVISFTGVEEMAMATVTVKREMYPEETSGVNEKGEKCINDGGIPYFFVGIKIEKPDDYESEAFCANSETKYTSVQISCTKFHEMECNIDDECLEGKLPTILNNASCIQMKKEYEEDRESCKSGVQTNDDTSMTIEENSMFNSRSVVHGCNMGHLSSDFIRGIQCQEYPILRVKGEEEKTDMQIAFNRKNSVKIKKQEKQEDLTLSDSSSVEDNLEEYTNKEENVKKESIFPTESTIKIECKEEIGVCELDYLRTENIYMTKTLESNSGLTINPVNSEKKISCSQLPQHIKSEVQAASVRNVILINPKMTFDKSLNNNNCDDSHIERTEDLEIKFESICDVSEFDIKAEESFGSGLNSENEGELDNKSPILQPLHTIFKDEPLALDVICEKPLAETSSHVVNSSRVMPKEARVVLERVSVQGVCQTNRTEIGNEISAFQETPESSTRRKNSIKYESQLTESSGEYLKSANRSHHDSVFITQTKCDLQDMSQRPKVLISYCCDFCKKTFLRSSSLRRHIRSHTREKTISCGICEASFCDQSSLKTHMRIHSGEKRFSCDVCLSTFTRISSLEDHLRIHSAKNLVLCDRMRMKSKECENESTKATGGYYKHVCRLHQDSVSIIQTKGDLKDTSRKHSILHTCDLCKKTFRESSHLKVHMRTHTGEKPFSCDVCYASFTMKGNLKTHKRSHTGEKQFSCDTCKALFTQKRSLLMHKRIHSGERPFSCNICKASFAYKSVLTTHMRIHTRVNPNFCNVCDVSFAEKGKLRTHTVERPFFCDVCDASFAQIKCLKRHKRTHTGERPFTCDTCEASFTQKYSLGMHMRIHSGERSYLCSICHATFAYKSVLKTHMRIHTRENLNICNVCHVSFPDNGSRILHMGTHK